jgi:Fe-S cluster assembly iron-binding protein IscA
MLEVTESAIHQINQYFNGKNPTPIRVFLNQSG